MTIWRTPCPSGSEAKLTKYSDTESPAFHHGSVRCGWSLVPCLPGHMERSGIQ
jgi:hypothetical protein